MITIDQLVESLAIQPSFIKIDVEGFDLAVLKGAIETLKSGSVRLVMFEHTKHDIADFQSFLESINWEIFGLDTNGNITEESSNWHYNYNLFARSKIQ